MIATTPAPAPKPRERAPPQRRRRSPTDQPRFDRKTGFVPGSLKVFIDLVDPNNARVTYRIYGPRAVQAAPAPAPQGGTAGDASAAYARGAAEPANAKDVTVV